MRFLDLVRPAFMFSLLGLSAVTTAEPGVILPKEWWNRGWEGRVPISVQAHAGVLSKRPVVLRWGTVAESVRRKDIPLSSLRLVQDGEPVPFQVDHLGAKGEFLLPGDLSLDVQDELVFVCRSDRDAVFHLYFSLRPKPPVAFPSSVEVASVRDGRGQAHYMLSTAGLEVGVQGTGLLDLAAHVQANFGRGAVPHLAWRGLGVNAQGISWGVFMNGHSFPTDRQNRWRVKLVVDGPVRKVVAVNCANSITETADGVVVLRGDVTRYFSMFGGVPLYDVEEAILCRVVQRTWSGTYTDRFHAGHGRDTRDLLWEGSSGTTRELALADKDVARNHTGSLVSTEQALDRWYAWYDEEEGTGIAVFFDHDQLRGDSPPPARISFEAGWERWSTVNRMRFAYENLEPEVVLRHRFRLVGLAGVSGEAVFREYRAWNDPAVGSVAIGEVEWR